MHLSDLEPLQNKAKQLIDKAEEDSMVDAARYRTQVLRRLRQGAEEYSGKSLRSPAYKLVREAMEEATDIGGWLTLAALKELGDREFEGVVADVIACAIRAYRGCEELLDMLALTAEQRER